MMRHFYQTQTHTHTNALSVSLQSYMEDHLKNKNRLEREWEALCSYQAEPSACLVGQGEQNSKRNRSDAVLACECAALLRPPSEWFEGGV